jgi:ABC-type uncharacterized transport system permease subunit
MRTLAVIILVAVMIVLIVGCDFLFLRTRFGLRLAVNVESLSSSAPST